MNVGIIGYGSMGKMLADKFAVSGIRDLEQVFVTNRSKEKLGTAPAGVTVCGENRELAAKSDVVFVCVRPVDLLAIIKEITPSLKQDTLLVSLNGNISFEMIGQIAERKTAKVIPGLTAEINRSQSLVCYNESVTDEDKTCLKKLLGCIGNVIELPEKEMGMGSELVSCMPGFIASIFDVICKAAKKHTEIPDEQIVWMVLSTLSATGDLMLQKDMTFEEVVTRVATRGGITQEGTAVVYEKLPEVADELFEKTLAKRRMVAEETKKALGCNMEATDPSVILTKGK
ncbi:MAG: NAD(P)-binding domain-containing protein [Eubacterium sp.]|nr:NAD(P)-binding domain-containing protein [Eubacterium sp.]